MDFRSLGAHHLVVSIYHDGSRGLQDRFDTRRLADRIEERLVRETIDDDDRAFIEARDMFFLATADEDGAPQCSYKGGDPGFVRVLDEHTIAFPSYDGNGMYLSLGNLLREPARRPALHRLRGAEAAAAERHRLDRRGRPAARRVRRGRSASSASRATEVFPNCPRYIHKLQLVERSRFVPREAASRRCRTGSGASGRATCWRPAIPRTRLGEQRAVPRERGEDGVDVVVGVVEVERDAEVRVALGGDDVLRGERGDERRRVGRADADERAARRGAATVRAELVEPGDEPLDEAAHVRCDRAARRPRAISPTPASRA